MKTYGKNCMVLMAVVLASVTSCVNDQLSEPLDDQILKTIPVLEEQLAAVEASAKDMTALNEALQSCDMEISGAVKALDSHVAALKGGMSLEKGTLATLDLQKQIAGIVGEAEASLLASGDMDNTMMRHILALEGSVRMWLGESFSFYYPVAAAHAKVNAVVTGFDAKIAKQKLYIDALASDIEAGLRKDDKPEELATLAASVKENSKDAQELSEELASKAAEMEDGYRTALKAAVTSPSEFDAEALNTLNSSVEVQSVDNTLQGLISRVAACESQLEDILTRLGALESTVTDLNKLLEMIQSLTFMSEYSEEKAVAEYALDFSNFTEEGYMERNKAGSIYLKYVVRPASAAAALTQSSLWNNDVKVFGYYAEAITKATPELFDFDITGITADQLTGVVNITLANSLSDDFFFKKTGAKLALSVTTGKTDLTSKFVEIVPKNQSEDIYVESLRLSSSTLEIDSGQTAKITAELLPGNATNKTIIWTTSKSDVATVSADGTVTAKEVGTAVITATTDGINEWGVKLSASCTVKVAPSIKIFGSDSVEEGKTTALTVQSPTYISPEYVTWEIGTFTSKNADGTPIGFSTNQAFASIDDSGNVSGLIMYYNTSDTVKDYVPLMVKCTIDGTTPLILYHEIRVVAVQPLGISINGLSDAENQVSTKVGTAIGLYGTMKPEGVSTEYFKLSYLGASDGYFAASNVGTTTVTVSIENGGTGKYSYFYPKGKSISRNIMVVVEPYYVQTVSLPATFEMNLDQTATLTPTMTSDVEGKDPTYPDLIWTSSAPEIVSINETTGEMTSLKEGTVTITATTSHANAVPSGQTQKSASCVVTVKKPTAPIAIGDYYYSDGTWSTERDYSKTVIGIVFAKVNAAVSDVHMINDHPGCSNGLVVSTVEYTTPMVESGASWGRTIYFDWMNNNGYTQAQDTEKYSGYGTTKGLMAINSANVSNDYGTVYFDLCEPLAQHRNSVEAPDVSSGWYLPSYQEMKLLYDNFDTVNASIQSVGGTVMTKQYTFTDTAGSTPKDYTKDNQYYCAYVNNGSNWTAFNMNTSNMVTTGRYINDAWSSTSMPKAEWPVRIILAF